MATRRLHLFKKKTKNASFCAAQAKLLAWNFPGISARTQLSEAYKHIEKEKTIYLCINICILNDLFMQNILDYFLLALPCWQTDIFCEKSSVTAQNHADDNRVEWQCIHSTAFAFFRWKISKKSISSVTLRENFYADINELCVLLLTSIE